MDPLAGRATTTRRSHRPVRRRTQRPRRNRPPRSRTAVGYRRAHRAACRHPRRQAPLPTRHPPDFLHPSWARPRPPPCLQTHGKPETLHLSPHRGQRRRDQRDCRPDRRGSTAQPSIRATVALTDAFRAAAVKELSGIRQAKATSLLAGKNHDDTPLTYHQHAHFLPWDQDGDRRIDEILLWVPGGLDDDELQALDKLAGRSVGTPKNVPGPKDLQVRIAAYGTAETILPAQLRGPYRQWRSVTPFVPYRHRKRHQEMDDYLTAEITRELTQRGIPAPICVSRDATDDWPLFTRHRWSRSNRTEARPGYGLTLEFAEPVSGPLALGHLSHFGLGVFRQQPHP
ncbi:type I-U CRISPR-associated protein Csb2 [Streptosporangium lutulentum]